MRKWVKRVLWSFTALVGLLVGGAVLLVSSYPPQIEVAKGFDPECHIDDLSCNAWVSFRRSHPFPYQAMAAKFLPKGKVVVVVSEPPPNFDARSLDNLAKIAFGDATRVERKRWMIGADGWLEDLVLTVDRPTGDDDTARASLRDNASILFTSIFGTTFGAEIEHIVDRQAGEVKLDVASYQVTPKELGEWMSEPSFSWQSVHGRGSTLVWSELASRHVMGAYASTDASLVMFTFPAMLLASTGDNSKELEKLRVPFREFAVASEGIIGGIWTKSGQIALLARARTTSQQVSPPLRFETFSMLMAAARDTEELAQSYERTQPFAGKLRRGTYGLRDWAPIYLSPQLVDTELGALLNVTDQMLKSWSSAGNVEYLFFDYAKPMSFPFGTEPLGDIVRKETGEATLLFNWNTAGSAVVVRHKDQSLMTSAASGSLPVTYGAGGKTAVQGGADLYGYEDKAYAYFSSLRDPNLQKVVQYTVLYQLLRAAVKDTPGATTKMASRVDVSSVAMTAARAKLASATQKFLQEFSAKPAAFEPKQAADTLAKFMSDHASIGVERLAAMLSDRNSDDARQFLKKVSGSLEGQREMLVTRSEELKKRVDAYNDRIKKIQQAILDGRDPGVSEAEIAGKKATIEAERDKLEADVEMLQSQLSRNPLMEATSALSMLVQSTQDLEDVRGKYVEAFDHNPHGSIRTPSIVVSWHNKDILRYVGGHNLRSRTLHLEASENVEGIELKRAADGSTIVRYSPSMADAVEGAAPKLARVLEHRSEHDLSKLEALVRDSALARNRAEALLFDKVATTPEPPPVFAKIGERVYQGKEAFVEDLRAMAGQSDCCIFVVHDAKRSAFVAEANLKPPPVATVHEVFDTPSLVSRLESFGKYASGGKNAKAAIFVDQPNGFVDAMVKSLQHPGDAAGTVLSGDNSGRGGPPRPPNGRSTLFAQPDFDGKPSWIRSLIEPLEAAKQKISNKYFADMGTSIPSPAWRHATVEKMRQQELEGHLSALNWETAKDGIPIGVKVSLDGGAPSLARDMTVIAGVDEASSTTAATILKSASEKAATDAATRNASAGQYLLTLKARLSQLDDKQLRRLVLVAQSGETKMYFTQLEIPNVVTRLRELHVAA